MSTTPCTSRVLVTGSSGALGAAVVSIFLESGAHVIGVDRQPTGPVEAPNYAHHQIDLTDALKVRSSITQLEEEQGPIDVLVHCAGGFRWSNIGDISHEDVDFLLHVNLKSSILLARELTPRMIARNFGRMVFVSSRSTLAPGIGEGPYAATKAGINALVQSVAAEVAAHNVTINAVLPAIIDTPANRRDMPDADFGTWVPRAKLAKIIFGLTQEPHSVINGALMTVSGNL